MGDQEFEFFRHGCVILWGAGEVKFSVIRNLEEKELILTRPGENVYVSNRSSQTVNCAPGSFHHLVINFEQHVLQSLQLGVVLEDLAEMSDEKAPVHRGAEGHKVRDGGAGNEDVAVLVGRVGVPLVPADPRGLRGGRGLQLLPAPAGLQRENCKVAKWFLQNTQ